VTRLGSLMLGFSLVSDDDGEIGSGTV